MQQLTISNDLLGNQQALEDRWATDGYWFFRDVLDHGPMDRLRARGIEHLVKTGLTNPEGQEANYNGGDVSKLDLAGFEANRPWRDFVKEPTVIEFFKKLTGEEPQWIPVGECRMSAPSADLKRPVFDFIHSDGYFNPGMYFKTCWIPLIDMDENMGGLALASGRKESPVLPPPTDGLPTIAPEQIAENRWRRANYRVGDILLFDPAIAHSGLVNRSDRFRMSIDIRLSTNRERFPTVGTLKEISFESLSVETSGGLRKFGVTDDTLCRNEVGVRVPSSQIDTLFQPGMTIVVAAEADRAIMVRSPK